jgi:hypothetical protein
MNWKPKTESVRRVADSSKSLALEAARAALQQQWPRIRQLFQEAVQAPTIAFLNNDPALIGALHVVYKRLPLVVRIAVKEEHFRQVCFDHRDRLFGREDVIGYLFWEDGRMECPPCAECGGRTEEVQEETDKPSGVVIGSIRRIYVECAKGHKHLVGTYKHLGGHSFEKLS